MLLHRLAEHADRARAKDLIPPPYYRPRPVRWAILLNPDGTPAVSRLEDRSDAEHPTGGQLPVPYVNRSGVRPPPMLLADDLRYVLGLPSDDSERERAESERKLTEFAALVKAWRDSSPDDHVARAVAAFYERGFHRELQPLPESAKPTDVAAFFVEVEWAHDRPSAAEYWSGVVRGRKSSEATGLCLVCGQTRPLLGTIPEMVKSGLIPAGGGLGRDAALVSMNNPAQGRGGKLQLASAPVCDQCGSAAMGGLNSLLADGQSRYRTPDSVVTWWIRDGRRLPMMQWLNDPQPGQVDQFFREFRAPARKTPGSFDADAFCSVTLSVNQARVVVRDWLEVPLSQLQKRLKAWDADHEITGLWNEEPRPVPLWLMAACAGRWGTEQGQDRYIRSSAPDGCERDLWRAALRGTPPPAYLLPYLMHRIRSDRHVDQPRAALLRLILARSPGPVRKENHMTGLDPDLESPPYQCGRLFAVLEEIQAAALGRDNINTTIADKYLPAAIAAPRAILTMLRKNAVGHLRRLRRTNRGAWHALNDRLDEVLQHVIPDAGDSGLPATLALAGQAEFILGYHHQRAADRANARATRNPDTATDQGDQQ